MAERETQRFEDWPKTEKTKKPSLSGDVVKGYDEAQLCQEYVKLNSMSHNITMLTGIADKAEKAGGDFPDLDSD